MIIDSNSPNHDIYVVIRKDNHETVGLVTRIDTDARTLTRLVHRPVEPGYDEATESLDLFDVTTRRPV